MAEGLLGGVLGGEDEKRGRGPGRAGRVPRHSIRGRTDLVAREVHLDVAVPEIHGGCDVAV
jgi:hypothetical protein